MHREKKLLKREKQNRKQYKGWVLLAGPYEENMAALPSKGKFCITFRSPSPDHFLTSEDRKHPECANITDIFTLT